MSEEIQQKLTPYQMPLDERVIITCLDEWPPEKFRADECPRHVLMEAAVGMLNGRVLDIIRANGKAVKWWIVEGYCRTAGLNTIPVYYDGAAMDAPAELLDKAKYTAMRRTSEGPWILINSPEIRESLKAIKEQKKEGLDGE